MALQNNSQINLKSARQKKREYYRGLKRRDNIDGTIMAILPFIGYILFSLFPMVFSLIISFTELHSYDFANDMYFLWNDGFIHTFDNYINLFKTDYFWIACENTLLYTLIVPVKLALQLFIAYILTKKVAFGKFFRILYFVPTVVSTVAVSVMWNWIYEPNFGIINTALKLVGLKPISLITIEMGLLNNIRHYKNS